MIQYFISLKKTWISTSCTENTFMLSGLNVRKSLYNIYKIVLRNGVKFVKSSYLSVVFPLENSSWAICDPREPWKISFFNSVHCR